MPAGVNNTDGSHVGTNSSLGRRRCPLPSKKARYFSRSSSVFIARSVVWLLMELNRHHNKVESGEWRVESQKGSATGCCQWPRDFCGDRATLRNQCSIREAA